MSKLFYIILCSILQSPKYSRLNLSKTINARLEYLNGSTGPFDRLQKHIFFWFFLFKQMVDVQVKKASTMLRMRSSLTVGAQATGYISRFTYCLCPYHYLCTQYYFPQVSSPLAMYPVLLTAGAKATS